MRWLSLLVIPLWLMAELTIMTEEFPPYNYTKDSEIKGLCTRVVQAVQKKVGDQTAIGVGSWGPSYERLLSGPDMGLFCTTRTEQREKLFKWVGPIAYSNLVFQENTLHPTDIKTFEDAKKLSVGVIENDSSQIYLTEKGFKNLKVYPNDKEMYADLSKGKFDLTTGNELNLPLLTKEVGLPGKSIRNTQVVIYRKGMYLAFSKDVSDVLISKWQTALEEMKSSGEYDKVRLNSLMQAYRDYQAE